MKMTVVKAFGLCWLVICLAYGSFGGEDVLAEGRRDITQGEFIKQLLTIMEVDLKSEELKEAEAAGPFAPYLKAAARLHMTKGEKLNPQENITREQAYVLLVRSLNLNLQTNEDILQKFEDGHTLRSSKKEVAEAIQLGLAAFPEGKSIHPRHPVSASEMAGMMKRYQEKIQRVPILHTNDVHARMMHNGKRGEMGYAKMAEIVKNVRRTNEQTLLVDMGDVFHGTNLAILNKGKAVADVMNEMSYDAMVPGNHDFNYGQIHLETLKSNLRFPMISANITREGKPVFLPYMLKEVQGKTLAFIGITAADTAVKTNPEGIEGLEFSDEMQTVRETVKTLKGKADSIILLSHSGSAIDERIANEIEGIDLILGGHSHQLLETPRKLKYAYVTQAFEYGKAVGRAQLLFHKEKLIGINGFLYRDDASKREDEQLAAVIKSYKNKSEQLLNEVVGEARVNLDGERNHVRTKETNLGNFLTDAMRQTLGTDIAFTNGGGIRSSIEKGNVTRDDLLSVLPFDDTIVVLPLTGTSIKLVLEHSVSEYPKEHGGFLQVSGLSFLFDPLQPIGKRVQQINVKGRPLDPNHHYTAAVNRFTAIGGDGYTMLKSKTVIHNSGLTLSKLLADYMKNHPAASTVEGRIVTNH
jgi:2',3'-cyclic-nucleotide 2'-phosphodiesterase (5'-nucleotidase family)